MSNIETHVQNGSSAISIKQSASLGGRDEVLDVETLSAKQRDLVRFKLHLLKQIWEGLRGFVQREESNRPISRRGNSMISLEVKDPQHISFKTACQILGLSKHKAKMLVRHGVLTGRWYNTSRGRFYWFDRDPVESYARLRARALNGAAAATYLGIAKGTAAQLLKDGVLARVPAHQIADKSLAAMADRKSVDELIDGLREACSRSPNFKREKQATIPQALMKYNASGITATVLLRDILRGRLSVRCIGKGALGVLKFFAVPVTELEMVYGQVTLPPTLDHRD